VKSRDELIAKRKALAPEQIHSLSTAAIQSFMANAHFLRGKVPQKIALYRPMPGEMDLTLLESDLRRLGHKLFFPRVQDRNQKVLEFVEVGPTDPFEAGPYNIQEPHRELKATHPGDLDVIIVPGVGFGPAGERMGMGAGYYDRFLPLALRALRVALAFDFQLLPRLDQSPWDQPVHWIFTDAREVKTPGAQHWLANRGA
jgi:5-formyltetrahydrofolate cyclo-ligase